MAYLTRTSLTNTKDSLAEANMTDTARPVCDCPEPCACYAEGYAQGKEKAHFEIRNVIDSNHADRCGCEPCITVREIARRTLTVRTSPELFERFKD